MVRESSLHFASALGQGGKNNRGKDRLYMYGNNVDDIRCNFFFFFALSASFSLTLSQQSTSAVFTL